MPDYLGADQRKTKEEEKEDKPIRGERLSPGAAHSSGTALRGKVERQPILPGPPCGISVRMLCIPTCCCYFHSFLVPGFLIPL